MTVFVSLSRRRTASWDLVIHAIGSGCASTKNELAIGRASVAALLTLRPEGGYHVGLEAVLGLVNVFSCRLGEWLG